MRNQLEMIRFFRVDSRLIILICVDLRNLRLTRFANCPYCTVRFTVLVAVAPPLALVAVTMTAEVPAGVPNPFGPGVGVGAGVLLLTPQPASSSKANPAEDVARRIFGFFERASANASAVSPNRPSSKVNCGGTPFGSGTAVDRAVVAMVSVTGVVPAAETDAGLKLQVLAAGRPLQAKVIAPSPEPLIVTLRMALTVPPAVTLALVV